jgi:hypothetical protein
VGDGGRGAHGPHVCTGKQGSCAVQRSKHGGEWRRREALGAVRMGGVREAGSMGSGVGGPLPMRAARASTGVYQARVSKRSRLSRCLGASNVVCLII